MRKTTRLHATDGCGNLLQPLNVMYTAPSQCLANFRRIRPVLGALCASLAVAALACSFDFGITRVGTGADGSLLVEADTGGLERFQSPDGGLNWQPVAETSPNRRGRVTWGGSAVTTPRGRYTIDGAEITRSHRSGAETAYSAAYLRDDANRILQDRATFVVVTTAPQSIAYDDRSGNVIIAMGSQGVVVGSSHGGWQRVAVQEYAPTDFSVSARRGLLRSFPAFWTMLLLLLVSFPAFALILAQCRWPESATVIAVTAAAAGAIRFLYQPALPIDHVNVELLLAATVIVATAGPVAGFLLMRWPPHAGKRRILALSATALPVAWVALAFPGLAPWADGFGAVLFGFLTAAAVALAILAAKPYWEGRAQLPAFLIVWATTAVGAVVPTLLWLQYAISGDQASWISVAVAATAALALFLYLKRRQRRHRVGHLPPRSFVSDQHFA